MEYENFYEGMESIDDFLGDTSKEDMMVSDEDKVSLKDACILSLRKHNDINLDYMSNITGCSKDEIIEQLKGKEIWADPEKYEATGDWYGCFTSKYRYCVNNLVRKLKKAREINKKYGLFDETISMLAQYIQNDLNPEDIKINFGATWVPARYVAEFLRILFQLNCPPDVTCDSYLGKWIVEFRFEPNYELAYRTYGTGRMPYKKVITNMLNGIANRVYNEIPKEDGDGVKRVLDEDETLMLQVIEMNIIDKWNDYVHGNSDVEQELFEIYLDWYGYGICHYDGEYLELADLNPNIVPYASQKDGIARILHCNNVLIANKVGAGKTITILGGAHELIRLGLGKRALIVLPKDTFEAGVTTYKDMYANDSILAVYPESDFIPSMRLETLKKLADDKYKVVFMTSDSFDRLTMSRAASFKKKSDEIIEGRKQVAVCRDFAEKRALEIHLRKLEKQFKKYKETFEDNECACFDNLNFDVLVVDEAHGYKNITIEGVCDSIVGMHSKGAKKADRMMEKVRYIQSIGGRVVFATGTPIPNSMVDLYALQCYLQPEELKLCAIEHFNSWVSTFCTKSHSFEIDVDGNSFRYVTRFSKFHNLTELMSMFSNCCEFDQIGCREIGVPVFDGYTNIAVKMSKPQKEYMKQLVDRIDLIRAGKVASSEDNILKIITDASKCSADIRIIDPLAEFYGEECKVSVCADNICKLYRENPGTTQIAFCDISTPKDGFNMYDALKEELVDRGIPASQIAFIHDATTESKRSKLEKNFNEGKIRILIGSTKKLGTGTNVQVKLLAIHHLDTPWTCSAFEQRNGRIIRQGNTNEKVFIYRYVTENSLDSYRYQILENKQRFNSQFFSATLDASHREESDVDGAVLDLAEVKALAIGNPLLKNRVQTANELEQAKSKQRKRRKEMQDLRNTINALPGTINNRKILLYNAKSDLKFYLEHKESMSREERKSFGEELIYALGNNVMNGKDRVFQKYQGFDVILPKNMKTDKIYVKLNRPGSNTYIVKMDLDKVFGCGMRLDYKLDHLGDVINEHQNKLEELEKQMELAQENLAQGNVFDEEVAKFKMELEYIDFQLGIEEEH